jgi:hypothetical protein
MRQIDFPHAAAYAHELGADEHKRAKADLGACLTALLTSAAVLFYVDSGFLPPIASRIDCGR